MDVDLFKLHSDELAGIWQGRLLWATKDRPIGLVILSIIAHNWPDGYVPLLFAVFPGFNGEIKAPFICSTAKVDKTGAVVADVILAGSTEPAKDFPIFRSTLHMRDRLRELADDIKLSDNERKELFQAARNWCNADRRLDPTMDPNDPDAKRLTIH